MRTPEPKGEGEGGAVGGEHARPTPLKSSNIVGLRKCRLGRRYTVGGRHKVKVLKARHAASFLALSIGNNFNNWSVFPSLIRDFSLAFAPSG